MGTIEYYLNEVVNRKLPPKTIYHYTSQEGFLGISDKNSMWATDIHYLNDSEELSHGQVLIEKVLEKSKINFSSIQIPGSDNSIMDSILNILNSGILKAYVCSFSEREDQLSQWRGYCSNGIGFCLGFNASKLWNSTLPKRKSLLLQCQYKEKDKTRVIEDVIDFWFQREDAQQLLKNTGTPENNLKCIKHLSFMLFQIAGLLKHKSFYEEAEWRLLFVTQEEIEFRAGKSMLIPYISFDLHKNPFDSIYHSPTPHNKLAKASLDRFIDAKGIKGCVTYDSSVPYRNY
ncbi:MAG: DUF2971 domain-containing protein [Proteobacteria bacterium]|nr:DUF2971 domain-containing protein [Pseudomonadota bacterium]MBU4130507.1 DUF2971 domain-containing protein [Pseudomonadota bacterium]